MCDDATTAAGAERGGAVTPDALASVIARSDSLDGGRLHHGEGGGDLMWLTLVLPGGRRLRVRRLPLLEYSPVMRGVPGITADAVLDLGSLPDALTAEALEAWFALHTPPGGALRMCQVVPANRAMHVLGGVPGAQRWLDAFACAPRATPLMVFRRTRHSQHAPGEAQVTHERTVTHECPMVGFPVEPAVRQVLTGLLRLQGMPGLFRRVVRFAFANCAALGGEAWMDEMMDLGDDVYRRALARATVGVRQLEDARPAGWQAFPTERVTVEDLAEPQTVSGKCIVLHQLPPAVGEDAA
jgi:hypothetical protein